MTTLDLDAIRLRAQRVAAWAHSADDNRLAKHDVPALIAELETLRHAAADHEPERIDLDQLAEELRAHPHRKLVESLAETMQEIDDDDGNGGGWGWYVTLVLACIDQWIRDLRDAGWEDPNMVKERQADRDRLLDSIAKLGESVQSFDAHERNTCTCPDLDTTSLDQPPGTQTNKGLDPQCPEHRAP